MTASRRQFTFGALMMAISGRARAGADPELPQQAQAERQVVVDLAAVYAVRRDGKELLVDVSLVNKGDPTDVIVKWGRGLGPDLSAVVVVDGEATALARVIDVDRRELVSRVGPRPVFAPLADAGELKVGTYRFAWVKGLPEGTVRLALTVETADGRVRIAPRDASWGRTEA